MRALLITPEGVEEVDHDGSLDSFYQLIGCECICLAGQPYPDHDAWADDEGMLHLTEDTPITLVAWHNDPLAGRILVTGHNDVGDTTPATMPLEILRMMVLGRTTAGRLSAAMHRVERGK